MRDMSQMRPLEMKGQPRESFRETLAMLLEKAATMEEIGVSNAVQGSVPEEEDEGEEIFERQLEFLPDVVIDEIAFRDCNKIYREASQLCNGMSAFISSLLGLEGPLDRAHEESKALVQLATCQLVENFVDVRAKEFGYIRESNNVDPFSISILLEQAFALSPSPNPLELEVLSSVTLMSEGDVTMWFTRKADSVKQLSLLRKTVYSELDTTVPGSDGDTMDHAPLANEV